MGCRKLSHYENTTAFREASPLKVVYKNPQVCRKEKPVFREVGETLEQGGGSDWNPSLLLTGEGLIGLGSNTIPVSGKTGGATPNTSVASKYLSNRFPQDITKSGAYKYIPKRVVGMPLRSPVLGRTLGRAVPILGYGLAIYDIATFPWADVFENWTVPGAYQSIDRINQQTNQIMGTDNWSVFPSGVK